MFTHRDNNSVILKYLLAIALSCCIYSNTPLSAQNIDDLWDIYNKGQLDSAYHLALPLFEKDTNNTELALFIGRIYADKADFDNATPLLIKAANPVYVRQQLWKKAWALCYLADCYFARGEYNMAAHFLVQSISLNASKASINRSRQRLKEFGFDDSYKEWRLIETPHFLFHLPPQPQVGVIKDYTDQVESVYDTINKFFNATLPKKIDYFVWNTSRAANRHDVRTMPPFCIVNTTAYQSIGYGIARVLACHVIPFETTTGLVDVGTGIYFNQDWNDKIDWASHILLDDTPHVVVHVKDLWKDWRTYDTVKGVFVFAGAFVQYLLQTGGKEKYLMLLQNQTYDNAKIIYGDALETMITDFEKKIYTKQ